MNGNVESLVEKDEEYVLLDLDSVCFQADIPPNAPYVLSGLDTMNPILTIGKTLRLVGEYQETVGTCYVFSERGSSRADLDGEQQPMGDSNQASSDQISAIYLGETFCSYISINNSSSFEARDVVIKAEIQTERQRILLLDTSKAPVESIRSGGRYDFIVEHDVKELGPHTLVCTALYNDGDGDRKYLPQFFKFVVANPLSVRTKGITFLEACLENHTKSNLYMDQVEFEPSENWTVSVLKPDGYIANNSTQTSSMIFRPPRLIKAGGGIFNYLYQLKQLAEDSGQMKVGGSNVLGKLQITWRTNLGEPGRLQTQQIVGMPIVQKDIDLQVVEVPSSIIIERPFLVRLKLTNQSERSAGPFEVTISQGSSSLPKAVVVNGIQKLVLQPLEAFNSSEFNLNMIATRLGVQKISGITICDTREQKYYDPLPDVEIFVDSE